jgi:hypothetical protein
MIKFSSVSLSIDLSLMQSKMFRRTRVYLLNVDVGSFDLLSRSRFDCLTNENMSIEVVHRHKWIDEKTNSFIFIGNMPRCNLIVKKREETNSHDLPIRKKTNKDLIVKKIRQIRNEWNVSDSFVSVQDPIKQWSISLSQHCDRQCHEKNNQIQWRK